MPEEAGNLEAQRFGVGIPVHEDPFYLKGSNHLDWGMQDRLSRMFNPKTGKAVMLAFDHGYIMGPTSGLERMDLTVRRLVLHSDVIMCTRGALRAAIPPTCNKPVSLRVTAGSTVLVGDDLFHECIGVDIEDAVRLNATAMAVQVCIGGKHEHATIRNLVQVIDAGNKFGIPTLGVTAVGRDMARDARYLGMASRVVAELGAHVIKTYYCDEGFDRVTAGCPVPVVIAGGKKLPELDALTMCYHAIDQGACGVDMGRNIFQADDPVAMIQAVRAVVHDGEKPGKALELYETLRREG